jgi:hypothetical protein
MGYDIDNPPENEEDLYKWFAWYDETHGTASDYDPKKANLPRVEDLSRKRILKEKISLDDCEPRDPADPFQREKKRLVNRLRKERMNQLNRRAKKRFKEENK